MKKCPYCAEDIQSEAIVCKHCRRDLPGAGPVPAKKPASSGMSNASKAALAIFMLLVFLGFLYVNGVFSPVDSSGRLTLPSLSAAPPVVTKAEFDQIREGMTYQQVVAIIGASGEVLSSSELAGYKTVMYSWANANGSNMNAMFQNGALITKAQLGLP